MVLKKFGYYLNKKKVAKKTIKVEVCDTIWKKFHGLMFRKSSPALLFIFKKNQVISIHSFFCKPFRAIWLDENKRITKIIDVKKWRPRFFGHGQYLLEIPLSSAKYPIR